MTAPTLPPPTELSADVVVYLVASDRAALESLGPACAMLDSFSIEWASGIVVPPAHAGAIGPPVGGTRETGLRAVIVASADAVLPTAFAAGSRVPVVRVPVENAEHRCLGLLYDETSNLPAAPGEAPFATVAIGEAGAKNAALLVVSILALDDARLRTEWVDFRTRQTEAVLQHPPLADL